MKAAASAMLRLISDLNIEAPHVRRPRFRFPTPASGAWKTTVLTPPTPATAA